MEKVFFRRWRVKLFKIFKIAIDIKITDDENDEDAVSEARRRVSHRASRSRSDAAQRRGSSWDL